MTPLLTTEDLYAALRQAGVFHDGESITRFVIDAKAGDVVKIHVERDGDARLLDVALTLRGVEIKGVPA